MIILKFSYLKKMFKRIFFILLIIILFIVSINLYKVFNSYTDINNNIKKSIIETEFITKENIINNLKNANKLITLEVELSQTIKVDKSFGSSELFSKYQYIKFFADCSYYVDISKITTDDIVIDNTNNKLTLVVPNPEIYLININKDKTSFSEAVNGLFRFGEVNLSFDEIKSLEENVYKSFENIISSDDIYSEALSSSNLALKDFLSNMTKSDTEILLYFK